MRNNSLNTIQKCVKIFRTLVHVGLILSVVCGVFALAAAVLWLRWNNMPDSGIDALNRLMTMVDRGSYFGTLSALIADFIACTFGAGLLWFTRAYLDRELADGTPFTDGGATQLRHLGVLTITLPLASLILQAIPYAAFDLSLPDQLDNGSSVLLGVVLILASVVFRYGAELTGQKEMIRE